MNKKILALLIILLSLAEANAGSHQNRLCTVDPIHSHRIVVENFIRLHSDPFLYAIRTQPLRKPQITKKGHDFPIHNWELMPDQTVTRHTFIFR